MLKKCNSEQFSICIKNPNTLHNKYNIYTHDTPN